MNTITRAVKKLRKQAGLTQQDLANRLDVSVRAVANYEADRMPAHEVLWKLGSIAADAGIADLTVTFSEAYSAAMSNRLAPMNDEERAIVRAVLLLARDKMAVRNWRQIIQELLAGINDLTVSIINSERVKVTPKAAEEAFVMLRYFAIPNVEAELNQLAKDRASKTGENYHKAYAQVLLDNPDLYNRYLAEKSEAAKGTTFESEMTRPSESK